MSSKQDSSQFPEKFLKILCQFSKTAWGNPEALWEQLPSGAKYIDLDVYFPALQVLFFGLLENAKVLIRNEYILAVDRLKTDIYRRGAYIAGQPGIGKTYFLVYALLYFLGLQQPVAIQRLDGHPTCLFFCDGTVSVHDIGDLTLGEGHKLVWALSDSNHRIMEPQGIFGGFRPYMRVIHTTSPQARRWKQWSKQVGAQCYVMDLWSMREIRDLATLLELDVNRMVVLAKNWGPVPRLLKSYFHDMDECIRNEYRNRAPEALREFKKMQTELASLNLSLDLPSPFFFIQPVRECVGGNLARKHACVSIPTQNLRNLLTYAFAAQINSLKVDFYTALSQCAATSVSCGVLFENLFHGYVAAGMRLDCNWVGQGSRANTPRLPSKLPGTTTLVRSIEGGPKTNEPPFYWLPPKFNFEGIDSALVFKDVIYAFQVTTSDKHKPPNEGLKKLPDQLPKGLKKLPCRVVFVGINEVQAEKVAMACVSKNANVPIAWSVVHPEHRSVVCEELRSDGSGTTMEDMEDNDMDVSG